MNQSRIRYKYTLNFILKSIILALIIFIVLYEVFLKDYVLRFIQGNDDLLDQNYYSDIFLSGTISLIIILFLLTIVLLFKSKINEFLNNVSLKTLLGFCLIIQILFQLIILFTIQTVPISDSIFYIEHAKRLAETGKYLSSSNNYTAFWPVGLPALLSIFYYFNLDAIFYTKLINILMSFFLLIILFKIFQLYLKEKSLKYFLISWTFFPNNLFASQVILTELPFTFLTWLSIFLVFKSKSFKSNLNIFLAGLTASLSTFFRANGLLVLMILGIILIFEKGFQLKKILILFLSFLIPISFWVYRNYLHFGRIVISSTNGGYIFLMGNNPASNGKVNFNFSYDFSNPNEVDESNKAYLKGFEFIKTHPKKFLEIGFKKIFYSYWRGDYNITWALKNTKNYVHPIIRSTIFFLTNSYFYIVILLSLFVLITKAKIILKNKFNYPLFALMFFTLALIFIYVGSERYIAPILPIHFYLASLVFDFDD